VVIFAASRDKIVIGADSREVSLSPIGRRDRYDKCKIVPLNGKFVFAAVGKSGHHSDEHPEATWDVFTLARGIASRNSKDSLGQIATAWGNEVAALDDKDAQRRVPGSEVLEGQHAIFLGFVDGRPASYQVVVEKAPAGHYQPQTQRVELHDGSLVPSGHARDIALEIAEGKTDRAKRWIAEFRREHASELTTWDTTMAPLIERVLELSINYSAEKDDVGLPIDLIEIDSSGTHWLRKKPNCQD
jgi:hypothetical protein